MARAGSGPGRRGRHATHSGMARRAGRGSCLLRGEETRVMYRSGNSVKDVPTRPADRYLLPVEVEHRLGISPTTRRRWTNRGLLRAYPLAPLPAGPRRKPQRQPGPLQRARGERSLRTHPPRRSGGLPPPVGRLSRATRSYRLDGKEPCPKTMPRSTGGTRGTRNQSEAMCRAGAERRGIPSIPPRTTATASAGRLATRIPRAGEGESRSSAGGKPRITWKRSGSPCARGDGSSRTRGRRRSSATRRR